MFAQQLDPSFDGKWDRLSPIAAAIAIVFAFVLSLVVAIAAVDTAELLMARAAEGAHQDSGALVTCDTVQSGRCG